MQVLSMSKPSLSTLPAQSFRLVLSAMATSCLAFGLLAGCAGDTEEKLIASARAYEAKREFSAATIELKRALDKNARSAEARLLLGKVLLEDSDPAAAEVELRKAEELGANKDRVAPDLARAMLLLGQAKKVVEQFADLSLRDATAQAELKTWVASAHSQLGQMPQARQQIADALRAQSLHPAAVMVQARMQAAEGDVEGALKMLDAVLAKDPGNADVGVAKGYLLWLGKDDAAGALETHRKVLAANPGHVAAQAEIVTILFRQGQVAEARQQFELLKKMAPQHPETVFFEAQFAYVDKQYKRSRELTDALLKLAPDHVRALELAAAAEYQMGSDEQAQDFLARALKGMPGLTLSRQILAQSYLRAGKPDKAIEALAPMLSGEKPNAESLALAGNAYLQLGDTKQADAAFKRAAQLAPDNAKVGTEVAMGMLGGGRADVALRDLEAIAATDKGPRADMALVSARISQGDLRGAMAAIAGLEGKMPGKPLPHQLRGQVLMAMRDAAGAQRSFEAALAQDGKYFPAVAALASMEVATGKPDAASQRVTAFLKTLPNSVQALMLLADIPTADGAPAADATQLLAQAVRANPGAAQTHMALIARHLALADRPAALAAAQAAAAALPNDQSILDALGQTQLLAGEVQQSAVTFRKLASVKPADAQVQLNLAEAEVAAKDFAGAERALRRALELDAEFAAARRGLAMLALRDNRAQDAIAIARDMQKRKPKDALGFAVEGDIEAHRKNWPEAAKAYQLASQLSGSSEAALKLHTVLRAANKADEADRMAAGWEKKRPKDPVLRFYLGDVATQKADYPAAEAHYRAVLETQPKNALVMNNLAWLMHSPAFSR
jgi:putative PEP-CTERM system TPR-repeat lipoprotein